MLKIRIIIAVTALSMIYYGINRNEVSLIFNKEFYLMERAYIPRDEASSTRWDGIMKKLRISNRNANSKKEASKVDIIDYRTVNMYLEDIKNAGNNLLKKMLE